MRDMITPSISCRSSIEGKTFKGLLDNTYMIMLLED